ncbi:alpha-L-glutamate ligase [Agrococcus sp. ARC_14]|uniref:ATP-grasp domain-containing protein n=1 Tax=Agrococcus sp. ARC_14 TaxID=2919927 RepID=UPI001F071159|nr:alpha-L-glutamate ligase [Agrococcus sp. ARC_14]MCH1883488.1 alpha-L-glutamate ligase [Agrococcus sp. ARC_14]
MHERGNVGHSRPRVIIIHDNPEWIPPLAAAFEAEGVEFEEWLLPDRVLDLSAAPPEGIFWSRLSASSHTRTDPHVKEYGRAVLVWLESAGRTVVNGSAVYEVEVSKVRQHRELERRGFDVPRTVAVFGGRALVDAASDFSPPFITKHNQGGKGLGVRRFDSHAAFEAAAAEFAPGGVNEPIDGITLIQEHVQPAEPWITRAEFIGGVFHYAVKVDVSDGSFELCPAQGCAVLPRGIAAAVCDVPGDDDAELRGASPQFQRREDITAESPIVVELAALLSALGVPLAGIEFIESVDGRQVVYDINTNTNYNADVEHLEQAAGRLPAARRIAQYLGSLSTDGLDAKESPSVPAHSSTAAAGRS